MIVAVCLWWREVGWLEAVLTFSPWLLAHWPGCSSIGSMQDFCWVDLIHAVQHQPCFSGLKTTRFDPSVLWSFGQVHPFDLDPAYQLWAVSGTTVHWRCVAKSTCSHGRNLHVFQGAHGSFGFWEKPIWSTNDWVQLCGSGQAQNKVTHTQFDSWLDIVVHCVEQRFLLSFITTWLHKEFSASPSAAFSQH